MNQKKLREWAECGTILEAAALLPPDRMAAVVKLDRNMQRLLVSQSL